MNKTLKALFILLLVGIMGYLIYYFTDSGIAGFIFSVIGVTIELIDIIDIRGKATVESKMKIRRAENTKITGVDYSGKSPVPDTKSEVQIEKIKGGEVIGVRSK